MTGHHDFTLLMVPCTPAPRSAPLNARQQDILDIVAAADRPVSTRDVLARINDVGGPHLVLEQVYRALRALHDRGLIDRAHVDDTAHAHWHLPRRSQDAS
ncbi:winged-helix domain-containing protein [Mycolicibacterium mageritense]|uniref:winged-helix domain-containing protein n=1 Tax=Mycolicibacterium mageritense TaxID=53462 RepID=UPI0011DB2BA0|nr:winged-helix domain-containing protein [Mycolicibacterium mageritense]TXI53496.1 MAG: hypothetical protein E6Q55_35000 [Mycolicibacterium mageritense]